MPPFFQVTTTDWGREVDRARRAYKSSRARAARWATDRASKNAQRSVAEKMQQAGLGRLGRAVGQQSALKKSQEGAWGVIYAKGKNNPDDRGAGAIEAYTRGATIKARNGVWLAIATNAIPKMTMAGGKRRRITPELYTKSGLGLYLGPLTFVPTGNGRAVLVAKKKVTLSPKTGRARPAGVRPSKTQVNAKQVVVFVLIRFTIRAQRIDEKVIIFPHAKDVPRLMMEYLAAHPA